MEDDEPLCLNSTFSGSLNKPLSLHLDTTDSQAIQLSESGTFTMGDFSINKRGYCFQHNDASNLSSIQEEIDEDVQTPRRPSVTLPAEVKDLNELESINVLGQGASGWVQKMRHIPSNAILALKVVPLDLTEKKSKQIVTELRTLHSSVCPFILSFFGAFYKESAISLVLEYMDGGSLTDIMRLCQKIPEDILGITTHQVLLGLHYLHNERRVIHRDIKPSNILLNTKGFAKLADFGVSGQMGIFDAKISFVGTVSYMSPERIKGGSHSFDADIWSLGLTLMECALGFFPYRKQQQPAKSPNMYDTNRSSAIGFWDVMENIVDNDVPALPEGQFSNNFRDFVECCLAKSPHQRPSAFELLNHPWIIEHDNQNSQKKLAQWVSKICKSGVRTKTSKSEWTELNSLLNKADHARDKKTTPTNNRPPRRSLPIRKISSGKRKK